MPWKIGSMRIREKTRYIVVAEHGRASCISPQVESENTANLSDYFEVSLENKVT